MGRKGKQRKPSNLDKTTKAFATVAQVPLTVRERLNQGLLPVAFVLGILGMLLLGLCGVLWSLPEDSWPGFLDPDRLPLYTTGALLLAGLLGWGCMQKGLGRLRKKIGWTLGGWCFVGLPMLCAAVLLAAHQEWFDPAASGWGNALVVFCYWYPPALVATSLFAYVTARSRLGEQGRFERGFWFALLVAPYALLMLYLVVGLRAPWLDDQLQETIHELGSGAIVAQVALAYFCGGGSSS